MNKEIKNNIVIHISGPSGVGKTTLGNKLKEKFGNKIVVKDLDDLRFEFVKDKYGSYKKVWSTKDFVWDKKGYQKWIDDYIHSQTKPLIFVGLNHMPWWNKKLYYKMHSDHDFYIKVSDEEIFKRKCSRFLNDVFVNHRDDTIKDILEKEKKTISELQSGLKHECGFKEMIKMNKIWNREYKKQGYKFKNNDDIFKDVSKILKKSL